MWQIMIEKFKNSAMRKAGSDEPHVYVPNMSQVGHYFVWDISHQIEREREMALQIEATTSHKGKQSQSLKSYWLKDLMVFFIQESTQNMNDFFGYHFVSHALFRVPTPFIIN